MSENKIKKKLSDWWQVTLEEELKKNQELKLETIQEFRNWLITQPHFPQEVDDLTLVMFIHGASYDLEYAKVLFENNYSFRTHKNIFRDRDVNSELNQSMINNLEFSWLEDSKTGYVLYYVKLKSGDLALFDAVAFGTITTMLTEVMQLQKGTVKGIINISDSNNMSFGHVLSVSLRTMTTIMPYLQEHNTLICQGVHIVNESSLISKITAVIWPFLTEKMKKQITFHKTGKGLLNQFSPEAVPEDFGGTAPPLSKLSEQTMKDLLDHREYFLEESKLRIDESKRPKKSGFFSIFSR